MSGWLPIESAPKDGSTIIATGLNHGRGPARHVALVYWAEERNGGWYDRAEAEAAYVYLTHWTPVTIPSLTALNPQVQS